MQLLLISDAPHSAGERCFVGFDPFAICNLTHLLILSFATLHFIARCVRPCVIYIYLEDVRNAHIEQGLEDLLAKTSLFKTVLMVVLAMPCDRGSEAYIANNHGYSKEVSLCPPARRKFG